MTTQRPIATLTLNPAIDVSYETKTLVAETKTPSNGSRFDPGGNGINVARSLQKLDRDVHACCILAGETGGFLLGLLQNRKVDPDFVEVPGDTRINCTIQQRRPPQEYKVGGVGPQVTEEALTQITDIFIRHAAQGIGVMTGSITAGVPENIYAQLCERLHQAGARAVVDSHGDMLLSAIETKPFLIKPNHYELELLCGKSLNSIESIALEARKLQEKGVEIVCVSMGGEGAIILNSEATFYASAPKVRVRCTTGVGDAMVAGLVAMFAEDKPISEALAFGVACGTATVTTSGTALFVPDDLPGIQAQIELTKLDI